MSTHPKPYHKTSTFAAGYRHPLDRERRAVWKARVKMHRHSGPLTAAHEDIALCLPSFLGPDGRLDPSHETIAKRARFSVNTVKEALKRLAACGLLAWVQRVVRDRNRVRQTSNSYMLTLGDPPRFAPVRCEASFRRENPSESFIPMEASPAATAAMEKRRAEIANQMLRNGGWDGQDRFKGGRGRIDRETLRRLRAACAERRGQVETAR